MNSENFESNSLNLIPEVTDWTGAVRGKFVNRANPPYTEETVSLFDEKDRDDTKPGLNAETTYSFYDRSSLDEFARRRRMLQRWVDRLPPEKQKDIVRRMRHEGRGSPVEAQRFDGAFFELFLHEFLNGTGGYTVVEPKIGHLTPDFGVTETRPDGTKINYVVEATDINVTRDTDLESNWNERYALDVLNEIESPDYYLYVRTKGLLTTTPPKRALRRPFEELVKTANYDDIRAKVELYGYLGDVIPAATFRHGDWSVTGRLEPVDPELRPRKDQFVSGGPMKSGSYNDIGKTKERLYDKSKQYKGVDNLIIALRTNSWLSGIGESLFGRMTYHIPIHKDPNDSRPLPPPRYVQKPDGFWFNTSGPQNGNVIGVVAFHLLHPHWVDEATAVFYGNPYTDKPLPSWTKEITHAEYVDGKVEIVEGIPPCSFAKDHEPWTDVRFHWE